MRNSFFALTASIGARRPTRFHLALLASLVVLPPGPAMAQPAPGSSPAITAVRLESSNIVVTAAIPQGLRRVTLEARERLGSSAWEPRVVARLEGTGGTLTFRLPRSRAVEMLRVRAEASEPLPASFYSGTNEFYEVSSGTASPIGVFPGQQLDARNTPPAETPREVVESDIWKIRGQTLYFFNQLRGLQAIDVTNPDVPVLRGTLELPSVGEDMYTLGDRHVILLARNGCSYNESEVVIGADDGGDPVIVSRLRVAGYIQESRLVGTALYLASTTFREVNSTGGGVVWEWGTQVSAFDLANPATPVARNTLWYPGSGNVVAATDRFLFVVTQDTADWWQSIIRSVDITSADGAMRDYESIQTAGRVPDKFKLRWLDGILTTVSEDWRSVPNRRVTTMIETFRLPDPRSAGPVGVAKLGELEVGRGEQLHATRFDGNRLYVVTFFRIDPLWVIDLANASSPRVAGSVDVPGWSTYIQPLGDQLVTIGVETNRVAVSLFNVANPANPILADRVRIGENYSWTEANWDEKAFSVLPEAGLVLVPYTGDTTNGYASRVQLVDLDLGASRLTARGVIEHQFQPRRATLISNRILSLSGWELLSVDAADRDHPVVRTSLPLAWPVDRVFIEGEFLVEIASGSRGWWGTSERPSLRVASAAAPNTILAEIALGSLPVLGATVRDSKLYLAQGQETWRFGPVPVLDVAGIPIADSKLLLTVFDLSGLPAVNRIGGTEAALSGQGVSGDLQAVWPKPDLLVFAGGTPAWGGCFVCAMPMAMVADARMIWPWPGNGGGGRLVAFDVSDVAAPKLASDVDLGTNGWWNFSEAHAVNGLVYLSHQLSLFVEEKVALDPLVAPAVWPEGTWVTRSYLDVVDFADPTQPLVRRPVSIPGRLAGISDNGALIYTSGGRPDPTGAVNAWSWIEYLDASAYDGVSAHLVDSLPLPQAWPHPLLVSGRTIYIGWPDYGTNAPATAAHSVQTWSLSDAGKFTRVGSTPMPYPANALAAFGHLLAVQQSDNTLTLMDATNPADLRRVGEGRPNGCQWYDLTHAAGELSRGLWLPLGAYGVGFVPTTRP